MFVWEWFNQIAAKPLCSQPDSEWNNQPPNKPAGLVPSNRSSLPALLYWDLVQLLETDVRDVLHSERPVTWDYYLSLCVTLPNAQLHIRDENIDIYLLPIEVKLCNQLNYFWKQRDNGDRQLRDYKLLLTQWCTLLYMYKSCYIIWSFQKGNIHVA